VVDLLRRSGAIDCATVVHVGWRSGLQKGCRWRNETVKTALGTLTLNKLGDKDSEADRLLTPGAALQSLPQVL
jgi:hypothetical protein